MFNLNTKAMKVEIRLCDFVFTGDAAKNAFWIYSEELDQIGDMFISPLYPNGISGDKLNEMFANRDALEAFARILGFLDYQNLLETRGGAPVLLSEDFYREIIDKIRMCATDIPEVITVSAETRKGSGIIVTITVGAYTDEFFDCLKISPMDAMCDPSGYDVPELPTDEIFKNLIDYCND